MRSGNHAIIQWIKNQHKEKAICFLNNVKHGDYNPFFDCAQRILFCIDQNMDLEQLRSADKHLLIYSYEDRMDSINQKDFMGSAFSQNFQANRLNYLGPSKHEFNIMIIRDPFNTIASRIMLHRLRGSLRGITDIEVISHNWKALARKAIDLLETPESGHLIIKYNRWAEDVNYRKDLSKALLGTFDDSTMGVIPDFGGGSSFKAESRFTLKLMARRWRNAFSIKRILKVAHYWKLLTTPVSNDMKTTERWKNLISDKEFRNFAKDPEIIELSEKLFGELAGTRQFVKSLR